MENKYNKYYLDRDDNFYTKYTKEEIRDMIDPFKPATFIPFLQDMDYPYFESEWGWKLAQTCSHQKEIKTVFGKYISTMRLYGYKFYRFEDSQYHKELTKFALKPYGVCLDEERRVTNTLNI